jgi:phosphoglycolate phosphatase
MPKYCMVVFDSDGTLANTLPWASAAFNQIAAEHGLAPISGADHDALRKLSVREMLARAKVPLWRLPALATGIRKLMAEHIDELELFDGIAGSLGELARAGVTLGVVSSNSAENVRAILGPENAALVHHFACSASIFGKATKLRSVLRASGVAARDTLYVGDELRDAEAAHKVGMHYGAVAWGYQPLETLRENAAETFETPFAIGEKLR